MMNKLFNELEKRCWDYQTNHVDTEKFAQLIVGECIHIADMYVRAGEGVRPTATSKIGKEIKKHFGIEENTQITTGNQ